MTALPAWVVEVAGEAIIAARSTLWGFRHETWIVTGIDGRSFVVQRRVDRSDPTDPRGHAIPDLVRAAGLPTPEPVRVSVTGDQVVVTMPFVGGVVGAELLGTDQGAALVGRVCGEVAGRLASMDPTGIPLLRTWASGDGLRVASHHWMDRHQDALSDETRRHLLVALDRAVREIDAATPQLSHGDLVPVNVLVRDDRVAAVLDLDRAQVAHPLYDAAWFAWVVSFYHGDVAHVACDAFARAAGLVVPSLAGMA